MEKGLKSVGIERSDKGKEKRVVVFSLLVFAACPHSVKLPKKNSRQVLNLDL